MKVRFFLLYVSNEASSKAVIRRGGVSRLLVNGYWRVMSYGL